ncbi:ATP-binding protein [Kitasatospora sp. NPDC004669]|uniref:sensor histidine kinase n=1 Tax=Kitasatospora sp. NPDC004669 TaxID=3154555 RepID=UPI0033AF7779
MRPPTPAGRIGRLRRRIAVLFALVSAVGLVGMTVLAVQADDESWRSRADAELALMGNEALLGLGNDDQGALQYPDPKEGAYDCPPVTLLTGGADQLSITAVPPEQARSLFERFHSGAGSTGLGLSIAAWVARAHGGSLTVTTSTRGGARFVLRVPAQKQP